MGLFDFLFSREPGWTWSGHHENDDQHTSIDTTATSDQPERSYADVYGDFVGSLHDAVEGSGPEADPDAEGDAEADGDSDGDSEGDGGEGGAE
jgi:hypothetical protein